MTKLPISDKNPISGNHKKRRKLTTVNPLAKDKKKKEKKQGILPKYINDLDKESI